MILQGLSVTDIYSAAAFKEIPSVPGLSQGVGNSSKKSMSFTEEITKRVWGFSHRTKLPSHQNMLEFYIKCII